MSKRPTTTKQQTASFGSLVLTLSHKLLPEASWDAWRVALKAIVGLPLTDADHVLFTGCTNRARPPSPAACREFWAIVGRGGGKSRITAFIGMCMATLRKYKVAPGETPLVLLMAPNKEQTAIILNYLRAFLQLAQPFTGVSIVRDTGEGLDLSNGIHIRPQVASHRTVRGFSCCAVLLDEASWFRQEDGSNPTVEILRALRPALARVPNSLLVAISTPHAQRGAIYDTYKQHFGNNDSDRVLVWKAPTLVMNATYDQAAIEAHRLSDPTGATAEYDAEFRADLELLFREAALEAAVVPGCDERAPQPGFAYVAGIDPSGGSQDSFTLAVAHKDPTSNRLVLDLVREAVPPFSPDEHVRDFAAILRRYRCASVYSDAYGGVWVREAFLHEGITVRAPIGVSDLAHGLERKTTSLNRSELYLELLAPLNSKQVDLLDHPKMLAQFRQLERRIGVSGRSAVDHPRGGHDDLSNVAALALVMCQQQVGLRAPIPETFTSCVNYTAAGHRCAIRYTGPWLPPDSHCRKHCVAHQAIWPAWQDYQREPHEVDEPKLSAAQFIQQRFIRPEWLALEWFRTTDHGFFDR